MAPWAINAAMFHEPPQRSANAASYPPMAGARIFRRPATPTGIYQLKMKLHILPALALGLGLLPTSRAEAAEGVLVTFQNVGGPRALPEPGPRRSPPAHR